MTGSILMCALGTALHIPSLILRYLPFKNTATKEQKKTLFIVYAVSLALSFAIYMIADKMAVNEVAYFKINLFLFCVAMSSVNILVMKNHLREHLFVFGVVALSILMLFTASLAINQLIGYRDVQSGIIQTSIILIICFCVFYLPLKSLIINAVTPFLNIAGKDYWKNIWFIPIAMFLASFFAYPMDTYMTSPMQYLSRIMIGGATLFICRAIAKDYGRFLEIEVMGKQIELQKQYYNELARKVENDRRARHDFKHHIAAIRGFVENDDKDGLVSYCADIEKTNYSKYIPFSGNAALDGILYHYMIKANQSNIAFSSECYLQDIGISDIDLCTLLGNALSNAFEAAIRVNGNKFITVGASVDKNFLVISIENSFDGKIQYKDNKILSRKRADAEGIGISSMKAVCEKYNGSATFECSENVFKTGFLLNIR